MRSYRKCKAGRRRWAAFCLAVALAGLPGFAREAPAQNAATFWAHFSVHHPLHEVEGDVREFRWSPPTPHFDSGSQSWGIETPVHIEVPVTGLDTANQNRDSHMLEVLLFPEYRTITVDVESVRHQEADRYEIGGRLTIAGRTRSFLSPAHARADSGSLLVEGDLTVQLSDFEIERPSLLMLAIDDVVPVHYRVELTIPANAATLQNSGS